ncbi:MAG: DUF6982 domain-containing protein [Candidatus Acidiferrales bacterium]
MAKTTPFATSTHKKVVVLLADGPPVQGYLNPTNLGKSPEIDLLTTSGEHQAVPLADIKCVYFVREFKEPFEPDRKAFMRRPKLDGLWVRLSFRDGDVSEGIVANDLLDLLDTGVQITPPDLRGNTLRMFIPRTALLEMKVLGVVGIARRTTQARRAGAERVAMAQSKLFGE